jgi:DNA mismatch endonuclease (patch repair protein)
VTDTFDPQTRSRIMALVKSRDTKPEVAVREALRRGHIRHSAKGSKLPGNPDVVLRRLRLAVFVNGCFWHWHGCKRSRMPADNRDYWQGKISRNVRRDRRNRRLLTQLGWSYCTIWECRISHGVARLLGKVRRLRNAASSAVRSTSSSSRDRRRS